MDQITAGLLYGSCILPVSEQLRMHRFCSSGFKCSGPSISIENVIGAAIKKFGDHSCKVTATNSIQTQYGITLDVPCKVTATNTGTGADTAGGYRGCTPPPDPKRC